MRKIITVFFLFFWFNNIINAQITFTPESVEVPCEAASFCVDVNVTNFNNVQSMQFSLNWDTAAMTLLPSGYTDYMSPSIEQYDTSLVSDGFLSLSWLSFVPFSIQDGDPFIQLCFAPNNSSSGTIGLGDPTNGSPTEFSGLGSPTDFDYQFDTGIVTFTDNQTPSISCPDDVLIFASGIVDDIDYNNLNDNCVSSTVTYNMIQNGISVGSGMGHASGEFFSNGITTVTYTATDISGNTGTCSFTVTIDEPVIPPSDTFLQLIPQVSLDCDNNQVIVDLIVVDFIDMLSMQFGVFWDATTLQPTDITFGLGDANPLFPPNPTDSIFFSWANGNGTTLADSSSIITFTFDLIGDFSLPSIMFLPFNQNAGISFSNIDTDPMVAGVDYQFSNDFIDSVLDNTAPDFGTTCLSDTTIYTGLNDCSAKFIFDTPVANDACDGELDYTNSHSSGDDFAVGTTTVIYTATDDAGNTSTCSFIVTVEDTIPPSITCPTIPTFTCPSDVSGLAPMTSDACGLVDITYTIGTMISGDDDASLETFDFGTTTVTYVATDFYGNTASCTLTVTVDDTDAPTITCPGDVIAAASGTDCSASATVPAPTVNDNCGIGLITYEINTVLDTLTSGATEFTEVFPVGTTTVTYIVYDENGQSATCDLSVTVSDTAPPALECPDNITLTLVGTVMDTVLMGLEATTSDNCGGTTLTYGLSGASIIPGPSTSDASGTTFNIGETTVTYFSEDDNGMITSCSFTVTVEEANSILEISCPVPDVPAQDADAPFCSDQVQQIPVTILSNEADVASITFTMTGATIGSDTLNASGTTFNVGTTVVTYTVVDIFGRDEMCSFEVVIVDNIDPEINCPSPDAFSTGSGSCIAIVGTDLILPTSATDNCEVESITFSLSGVLTGSGTVPGIPTIYPIGTTTITYTVTDIHGNTDECAVDVVVTDTQGPEMTCPANVSIEVPSGTTDTVLNNLGLQSVTESCGNIIDTTFSTTGIITISGTSDISGTAFPIGETIITYTTVDNYNNSSTCSFTVNVTEEGGTDLIDCPLDSDVCNATVTAVPTYLVDPTTISLSYDATTVLPGTGEFSNITLPAGPTVVTYTADDGMGNTDVCSFVINLDDVGPTFSDCLTAPLELTTDVGSCTATATWTIPTATDDCGIELFTASHIPPVDLIVGDHEIMYTATDSAGNATLCVFTITVTDQEEPVWDACPPSDLVLVPTGGANCESIATWTQPTATDACSSDITYTSEPNSGDTLTMTTVVVFTATDESGNTAVCTMLVEVEDNQAPVANCPDDIVMDADPDLCGVIAGWDLPTATDDCSTVGISCTVMPGDTLSIGVHIIVCVATDASGNDGNCSFTVTVTENSPPILIDCPELPILANSEPDSCGAFVTWPEITALDDCDTSITLTSTYDSGDYFPVGTTTVEYTATDDGNNSVTCSFEITVLDTEAPMVDCPENVLIDLAGNIITDPSGVMTAVVSNSTCDSVIVGFIEPVFTDNCTTPTVVAGGITNLSTLGEGSHTVSYIATDGNPLNETLCEFTIVVQPSGGQISIEATPNDTVCQGTITLSVIGGASGATYEWSGPAGWGSTEETTTIPPFNGEYNVVCTLPGGCTSTASIDITYGMLPEITIDNNGPLCGDEGDLELNVTGAPGGATILWTGPGGQTFSVPNPVIQNAGSDATGEWCANVSNGICDVTLCTNVIVGSLPNVTVNSDCNESICLGETCTIIGQEVTGGQVTYNWSSNPVGCIPDSIAVSIFDFVPTTAGDCTIYYSISADNCSSEVDSITISVSGAPVAVNDEFSIEPSDSITSVSLIINDEFNANLPYDVTLITPQENVQGTVVVNPDGTMSYNPQGFAGTASFIYELCVNCDTENCTTGIVNIDIGDESCRVPTVITPNGDDTNEFLFINCLDSGDFQESEMQIFNQWGDEVFYAKPYKNDWNGTLEGEAGKDLPDGTYFFIFKLDNNAEVDKGHITIFR